MENPNTGRLKEREYMKELKILYSKSSINLLIIAGLFFLLININIEPFYKLMSNSLYGDAIWVVLMISISKLILMSFGCGPAILATSKFYKITLPFSVFMAITVYFLNDILNRENKKIINRNWRKYLIIFIFLYYSGN